MAADLTPEQIKALADQALGGTLERNAAAYTTGDGRSVQSLSLEAIIRARRELQAEMAASQPGGDGTTNFATFSRPS
jgi:hypothetical protein